MAFICGGLKILKFCSGAQVQGIFRPRRSGFKGLRAVAKLILHYLFAFREIRFADPGYDYHFAYAFEPG